MKQQHILQPKLRFPEFEGDWNETKLKEITSLITKGTTPKSFYNQGINFVKLESLDGFNIDKRKFVYINSETHENELKRSQLKVNDILFAIAGATVGKVAYVKQEILPANTNQALAIIRLKENVNHNYILQILSSRQMKNYIYMNMSVGAQPNISLEQLNNFYYKSPSLPEQQKIADYLSTIDTKINLLEEKKAQLVLYKKAMMQKLFAQEIRFKPTQCHTELVEVGIDEVGAVEAYPEWEEKRLGEIGFFQTSSIDKLSRENEKEIFLINYMNVYRHEKINKLSIVNYQKVTAKDAQIISCNIKKGDILFTPSSETPSDIGHSVVIFEDVENAVFSYHLMRFRPNIKLDLKYSHYFCNIPKVLDQLSKYATGSTRFTISVKSFSNVIVDIPCYEEQQKIADFLSVLDENIEKVTEQISQTQSFKKAMLQQMFV